jgi:hypothetical protein
MMWRDSPHDGWFFVRNQRQVSTTDLYYQVDALELTICDIEDTAALKTWKTIVVLIIEINEQGTYTL